MAARLRRDLGVEVERVHGRYGEFKVLVDGAIVVDGGVLAALGVLPSVARVVGTVHEALERTSAPA